MEFKLKRARFLSLLQCVGN